MVFVAAGEIIGSEHQVRTVKLSGSTALPDGEYRFIDMYCSDSSCDCRKTMIHVYCNDVHVSTINFGWESRDFYRKWFGSAKDRELGEEMAGASIDINSPNRLAPGDVLAFFRALLDDNWIAIFRRHYAAVKRKLAGD